MVGQVAGRKRDRGAVCRERWLPTPRDVVAASRRALSTAGGVEAPQKAGRDFRRAEFGHRSTCQPGTGDDRLASLAIQMLTHAVALACNIDDARNAGRRSVPWDMPEILRPAYAPAKR